MLGAAPVAAQDRSAAARRACSPRGSLVAPAFTTEGEAARVRGCEGSGVRGCEGARVRRVGSRPLPRRSEDHK